MAQLAEILLPWPEPRLSPNTRQHHMVLASAKAAYFAVCRSATSEQIAWDAVPAQRALALDITFHPPTKRRYDLDNLYSRMKSGIDGLCAALQIDDSQFEETTLRRADKQQGGSVIIKVREL